MAIKTLVLSDNRQQLMAFDSLVKDLGLDGFAFAVSPNSNVETFSPIRPKVYDLKNGHDIEEILSSFGLVISMHCKQIFPSELFSKVLCINVHPGYNPVNRGWYPQVFAIVHGRIVGATIHVINEKLDGGPIIDRITVPQHIWDTSLSLYERILEAEIVLLRKNLTKILARDFATYEPENDGHLFLRKDFADLCCIDLDEQVAFKTAIDRLRALTHGNFKNAYFKDPDTGRKVFVKIDFEVE